MNDYKIDIVEFMITEINNKYPNKLNEEKVFMMLNKTLYNDVLYSDSRYKESTIILTNIFRNLMLDFCKEVNDYINKEGVYKNE